MVEVSFFGWLVGTLASALSVVLVSVGLTAVTYVAATLITAMRALPGPPFAERSARRLGVAVTAAAAIAALVGLRVGGLGTGGELVPTAAIVIAGAAALGSVTACLRFAGARGAWALGVAREGRRSALAGAERARVERLEAQTQKRLQGDDLRDEVVGAEASLGRLGEAIGKLREARGALAAKGDRDRTGEVGRALVEVTTKLELGERVLAAAEAAAYRLACNEPLRRLARRRPTEATVGLEALESENGPSSIHVIRRLGPASSSISAFLREIGLARGALAELEPRRPASVAPGGEEDPWTLARRDLDALENAYAAVLERVDVVCVRHQARARMDEVADAAGALTASARARGEDQAELEELATEVTRAEAAVVLATPTDGDARALAAALARSTAALGRTDGASLDELLTALRAIV